MKSEIYLSVIIPVYNEDDCLLSCFENVYNQCKKLNKDFEIIFIDDGSTDNTPQLLQQFKNKTEIPIVVLTNPKNRGKGYSLRKGVSISRGNYIITTDADLSVPIDFMTDFLNILGGEYDIVIGTRKGMGAEIITPQPLIRRNLSNIYRVIVRKLINSEISDFTCGFKGYKDLIAKKLFSVAKTNKWGIDAEILYLAKHMNLKIKEVPVKWKHSGSSRVNLVYDVLYSLYELIKVRVIHRKSKIPFSNTYKFIF